MNADTAEMSFEAIVIQDIYLECCLCRLEGGRKVNVVVGRKCCSIKTSMDYQSTRCQIATNVIYHNSAIVPKGFYHVVENDFVLHAPKNRLADGVSRSNIKANGRHAPFIAHSMLMFIKPS